MTKLKRPLTALLFGVVLAGPWCLAPAFRGLAQDGEERRDVNMKTPGSEHMRIGPNERGDNEMVIERPPQKQQEMPNMGPIYVIPQVNRGPSGPVVLPVPPPQAQPPQALPPQAQPPQQ